MEMSPAPSPSVASDGPAAEGNSVIDGGSPFGGADGPRAEGGANTDEDGSRAEGGAGGPSLASPSPPQTPEVEDGARDEGNAGSPLARHRLSPSLHSPPSSPQTPADAFPQPVTPPHLVLDSPGSQSGQVPGSAPAGSGASSSVEGPPPPPPVVDRSGRSPPRHQAIDRSRSPAGSREHDRSDWHAHRAENRRVIK